MKAIIVLCSLLVLLLSANVYAMDKYVVTLDRSSFEIENVDGFQKVYSVDCGTVQEIGSPELPTFVYNYLIPENATISGIHVISVTTNSEPGSYNISPHQQPKLHEDDETELIRNMDIYSSSNIYPSQPIEYAGAGYFRGHQIASIIVYPFQFNPALNQLEFISEITFEFVYTEHSKSTDLSMRDDIKTYEALASMIENKSEVLSKLKTLSESSYASSSYPSDSVPYLIITTDQLYNQSSFVEYVEFRLNQGLNVEVFPMSAIEIGTGNTKQEKIRNKIKAFYENKHTEYVLLAGNVDSIPSVNVVSQGETISTDQYYSCLDGEWNTDGDDNYAEFGEDTLIDYIPDVYIGRFPCTTPTEAQNILFKTQSYEEPVGSPIPDYFTKAVLTSSYLFRDEDGMKLNEQLRDLLPSHYTYTEYYNDDNTTVQNEIDQGCGLLLNCSHATSVGDFCTQYIPPVGTGIRKKILYSFFEGQSNYKYSIFINRSCQYNYLNEPTSLARSYILAPTGGGVGYISPTHYEWSGAYTFFHRHMLNMIFQEGETRLGHVMAASKMRLSSLCTSDNIYRCAFLSYNYLGDPILSMWTDDPEIMTFAQLPDSLCENSSSSFTIRMAKNDLALPGVQVCVNDGTKSCLHVATTDANGYAHFSNVSIPDLSELQYMNVYAKMQNHIPIQDVIAIHEEEIASGCPMLYVKAKGEYKFVNNLLAKSEDTFFAEANNVESYPVYSPYVGFDGMANFRIREDEKEKSFFDRISAYSVIYPSGKDVVYTDKDEFRVLTGEKFYPVSAIDNNGVNLLTAINESDGNAFTSKEPGYIVVKYELPQAMYKPLEGPGGGGVDPVDPGKPIEKAMVGNEEQSNKNITISVLNGLDSWNEVKVLYPRVKDFKYFTDLSDYFTNNELTLKIEWGNKISIDAIPFCAFEEEPLEQKQLNMFRAIHSSKGNVTRSLQYSDNSMMELIPGEYVDFTLGEIRPPANYSAAVRLECDGRYIKWKRDKSDEYVFDQNYPNPFNPSTTFSFAIPTETHVNIEVFNVIGQKVATVADRVYHSGEHTITWNGKDSFNTNVASGIYFAKFKANDFSASRKMVILR